ncbi:MAG: hypothetical protein P1U46_02765 [Patescibacteria group bacterium]|nr:hypothetical protein [Patescibacteria group bacterium]
MYANTMNLKHNLKLSKKEIKQSCRNAIMIKVSDRIHNLSDMLQTWEFTPEKIDKKIIETEKFLLKIAKEI